MNLVKFTIMKFATWSNQQYKFSILKNWWTYHLSRHQTFTLCSISNNLKRNNSDELWKLRQLRKISYWRKRLLFDCLRLYIFHRERFMLLKQFCNFVILTYVRKISLKWNHLNLLESSVNAFIYNQKSGSSIRKKYFIAQILDVDKTV